MPMWWLLCRGVPAAGFRSACQDRDVQRCHHVTGGICGIPTLLKHSAFRRIPGSTPSSPPARTLQNAPNSIPAPCPVMSAPTYADPERERMRQLGRELLDKRQERAFLRKRATKVKGEVAPLQVEEEEGHLQARDVVEHPQHRSAPSRGRKYATKQSPAFVPPPNLYSLAIICLFITLGIWYLNKWKPAGAAGASTRHDDAVSAEIVSRVETILESEDLKAAEAHVSELNLALTRSATPPEGDDILALFARLALEHFQILFALDHVSSRIADRLTFQVKLATISGNIFNFALIQPELRSVIEGAETFRRCLDDTRASYHELIPLLERTSAGVQSHIDSAMSAARQTGSTFLGLAWPLSGGDVEKKRLQRDRTRWRNALVDAIPRLDVGKHIVWKETQRALELRESLTVLNSEIESLGAVQQNDGCIPLSKIKAFERSYLACIAKAAANETLYNNFRTTYHELDHAKSLVLHRRESVCFARSSSDV